ncbi:MAG: 30S ribosome-binding factor RbfA [Chitinispirillia bacterium]|jgi:ribosome-binding factor A
MSFNIRFLKRMEEQLQREIAWTISNKVNDPRVPKVITVTTIKLAPDTRNATIFVSIFGDDEQKTKAIKALNRAAPFIQRCVSSRISMKNFPKFFFKLDNLFEKSQQINSLLAQVKDDLL